MVWAEKGDKNLWFSFVTEPGFRTSSDTHHCHLCTAVPDNLHKPSCYSDAFVLVKTCFADQRQKIFLWRFSETQLRGCWRLPCCSVGKGWSSGSNTWELITNFFIMGNTNILWSKTTRRKSLAIKKEHDFVFSPRTFAIFRLKQALSHRSVKLEH